MLTIPGIMSRPLSIAIACFGPPVLGAGVFQCGGSLASAPLVSSSDGGDDRPVVSDAEESEASRDAVFDQRNPQEAGGDGPVADVESDVFLQDAPGQDVTVSDSSPPPRAYVSATLTSTSGACLGVQGTQQILTIGTFAVSSPDRVSAGGPITITCNVSGSDPNFSVNLNASSDSTVTGGSITIEASGISIASGGQSLTASFVGVDYGQYEGTNCTMSYAYDNVANVGGIAPGRVWGHISCPSAVNAGTPTASGQPSTCDAEADFVFENCGS